jgi:hypothetical protein
MLLNRDKLNYLWRAVDQDGFELEALVQSRRNKKAAKRLLHKLLKKQGRAPRVLVTDKLKSYGAAKTEIMPGVPPGGRCLTARAPPAQGPQQSGRELPSTDATTRTPDEAVQVGPPRSTLRLDPRPHRQPRPPPPRPRHRQPVPRRPRPGLQGLGRSRRRPFGRLITGQGCAHATKPPHRAQTPIKLTVPKLGISFWNYLGSRFNVENSEPVPDLADVVRARCAA